MPSGKKLKFGFAVVIAVMALNALVPFQTLHWSHSIQDELHDSERMIQEMAEQIGEQHQSADQPDLAQPDAAPPRSGGGRPGQVAGRIERGVHGETLRRDALRCHPERPPDRPYPAVKSTS